MKASDWRRAYEQLAELYYQATGSFAPTPVNYTTGKPVQGFIIAPERLRQFYEEDGMCLREIAEILNCSISTASNLLKRAGISARPGGYPPKPQTDGSSKKKKQEGWQFGGRERKTANGYVFVYLPKHPYANKAGEVAKHRLVMERELGRYLDPSEVVHHINHIRDDNRPENLVVMDWDAHNRMHGEEMKRRQVKEA